MVPVRYRLQKQNSWRTFELADVQAQAIVDMRLRALTGLEREKLEKEYAELMEQIERVEGNSGRRKVTSWSDS